MARQSHAATNASLSTLLIAVDDMTGAGVCPAAILVFFQKVFMPVQPVDAGSLFRDRPFQIVHLADADKMGFRNLNQLLKIDIRRDTARRVEGCLLYTSDAADE